LHVKLSFGKGWEASKQRSEDKVKCPSGRDRFLSPTDAKQANISLTELTN